MSSFLPSACSYASSLNQYRQQLQQQHHTGAGAAAAMAFGSNHKGTFAASSSAANASANANAVSMNVLSLSLISLRDKLMAIQSLYDHNHQAMSYHASTQHLEQALYIFIQNMTRQLHLDHDRHGKLQLVTTTLQYLIHENIMSLAASQKVLRSYTASNTNATQLSTMMGQTTTNSSSSRVGNATNVLQQTQQQQQMLQMFRQQQQLLGGLGGPPQQQQQQPQQQSFANLQQQQQQQALLDTSSRLLYEANLRTECTRHGVLYEAPPTDRIEPVEETWTRREIMKRYMERAQMDNAGNLCTAASLSRRAASMGNGTHAAAVGGGGAVVGTATRGNNSSSNNNNYYYLSDDTNVRRFSTGQILPNQPSSQTTMLSRRISLDPPGSGSATTTTTSQTSVEASLIALQEPTHKSKKKKRSVSNTEEDGDEEESPKKRQALAEIKDPSSKTKTSTTTTTNATEITLSSDTDEQQQQQHGHNTENAEPKPYNLRRNRKPSRKYADEVSPLDKEVEHMTLNELAIDEHNRRTAAARKAATARMTKTKTTKRKKPVPSPTRGPSKKPTTAKDHDDNSIPSYGIVRALLNVNAAPQSKTALLKAYDAWQKAKMALDKTASLSHSSNNNNNNKKNAKPPTIHKQRQQRKERETYRVYRKLVQDNYTNLDPPVQGPRSG